MVCVLRIAPGLVFGNERRDSERLRAALVIPNHLHRSWMGALTRKVLARARLRKSIGIVAVSSGLDLETFWQPGVIVVARAMVLV